MLPVKRFVATIVCCSALQLTNAQQTAVFTDPESVFKQAKEYFQREQYGLAYPLFKELSHQLRPADRSGNALKFQETRYYTIVCGLMQNEGTAVDQAIEFVDLDDNQARVQQMAFHLGEYYFRMKDYYQAVSYYEKSSAEHLSEDEIADLKF